jgi:hypothetical protein
VFLCNRAILFISHNPLLIVLALYRRQSKYQIQVARKFRAKAALEEAKSLEGTVIYPGYFLDYYVTPAIETYLFTATMFVDMLHNEAAIPGSGNTPVAYSHTSDVGDLINASLDLEKWEPETFIICDKVTLNDFVRIAEVVKGIYFAPHSSTNASYVY